MIFNENRLLADDSHETSYLIFSKIVKMPQNLSSVAVVIGALRVKSFYIAQLSSGSLSLVFEVLSHLLTYYVCVQTGKALMSLCGYAGWHAASLVVYAISSVFVCAGLTIENVRTPC